MAMKKRKRDSKNGTTAKAKYTAKGNANEKVQVENWNLKPNWIYIFEIRTKEWKEVAYTYEEVSWKYNNNKRIRINIEKVQSTIHTTHSRSLSLFLSHKHTL